MSYNSNQVSNWNWFNEIYNYEQLISKFNLQRPKLSAPPLFQATRDREEIKQVANKMGVLFLEQFLPSLSVF